MLLFQNCSQYQPPLPIPSLPQPAPPGLEQHKQQTPQSESSSVTFVLLFPLGAVLKPQRISVTGYMLSVLPVCLHSFKNCHLTTRLPTVPNPHEHRCLGLAESSDFFVWNPFTRAGFVPYTYCFCSWTSILILRVKNRISALCREAWGSTWPCFLLL